MVSTMSGGGYGMNSRPPTGAGGGTGNICFGLEIEGHSMPTSYKKTRVEPKDHMRTNLRRLKEMQRQARERETETNKPVKALWKSSKYDGITSKVLEELQKPTPAPSRPQSANYLRAHSRTGLLPQSARSASIDPPEEQAGGKPLEAPRAATARESRPGSRTNGNIDYVKLNGILARKYNLIRSASMTSLDVDNRKQNEQKEYKIGHMPKYLLARRQEWLEEQKQKELHLSDPDMPPGHRLMPDAERRETLERIKQKRQELEQEIALLPISCDTLRVKKKREELEQKLAKVDEAVRIFSRSKVYVRLDS